MQLSTIKVDGFGVLSHLEIDHLSSGLNVVYGRNGSGKTTILQFLRGMFCNFDQARRLRLLPPLKGGHPGGSLEVALGPAVYEIIRHSRPGHHDTLAIKTQIGDPAATSQIREQLAQLDFAFLKTIFFVSGPEAHSIDEMVRYALRDGIELRTERRQANWIAERIDVVEKERQDLFGPEPSRNSIEALELRKKEIAAELATQLKKEKVRDADWYLRIQEQRQKVEQLKDEATWLHQELQLVQADLTEVNDRRWSRSEQTVIEQTPVERVIPQKTAEWVAEIKEIDEQIAHAQQVLRDLANSRFRLTLATTELTGSETPDQDLVFDRQRSAINAIEKQTLRLEALLTKLQQSQINQECICQNLEGNLGPSLTSIQQQLSLLCQELSRQQVASEQLLLFSQRDGVDRCEDELTRQIQSLRIRRDELLHNQQRPVAERIQFCTRHETKHCQCEEHQQYLRTLSVPDSEATVTTEYITSSRSVVSSNELPGDALTQRKLMQHKHQLQQQWWRVLEQAAQAQLKLDRLNNLPNDFAEEDSLQRLQLESSSIEQQLADAREQWHSLAVLQTVLQRTREKMQVETTSPVIQQASTLLNKMTQGRYTRFRFNAQSEELLVLNDQEAELPIHALSRGTLEQASLSFRLALWCEYRRRGMNLPLILDEVLADSDENRLSAAIQTLVEFSSENHQVIFMTCQEHLANLFEKSEVIVQNLPGSHREKSRQVNRIASTHLRETNSIPAESNTNELLEESSVSGTASSRLERVQPDNPFWLQTESPVTLLPSLGEQMARRIGSIGVQTVSELIDLDPENTEIPLESLQISSATLRKWQAEARLLCCVPDLTGKDAQLLVLCGVFSPSELAEADADALYARTIRLQEAGREYDSFTWLSSDSNWPSRSHFARWIRSGQRARSFRTARSSGSRRHRQHPAHRTPSAHSSTNEGFSRRNRSTQRTASRSQQQTETEGRSLQTVRLHEVVETSQETSEFRFFLNMDSPIVDAPGIGPKTATRFEKIGVMKVSDLVNRDAEEMSTRLKTRRLTEALIQEWQQQAILVCRIPELRGHDAQVLVACGLTNVAEIAEMSPKELYSIISPYIKSDKGQRMLRSAKTPDLDEVTDWIEYASNSRSLRAA